MSKSKGNVIYADDLVELFGVDAVRYFVLHEMPFENDGVITWELMVERMNSDLANTLGNLVNRTISMTNKYLGGVAEDRNVTEEVDQDLKAVVTAAAAKVEEKMDKLRVADAISEVFTIFKRCNKYIDETEPWILGKDVSKKDRLSTVLYNLLESITIGASLLEAFMPETTDRILQQIGASKRPLEEMSHFGGYVNGTKVTDKPEILFQRLDMEEVLAKAEEITAAQIAACDGKEENVIDIPDKEEITFDDFSKMQFQVGEIISCEEVKKSKKLLCSQVKVGSQIKQIVSGIKQYYTPQEMVGKKVMVLVNLKPAKLAGVLSEGMLLCAEDADGNLALVTPEKEMPAGAEIC
jgi:methionyl-tRNA synthetase